ncbi:MAG: hypothetical protein CVT82_00305 [Alphaproteobacteria bacterium HGW-Alphaproteobacteria-4]|jgi:hypothetical protein|nr:MAG: hypothetical protein CVT82_00305 [Alphaproteobacteria bacterium HGW-Alphaproteobacteria-4]
MALAFPLARESFFDLLPVQRITFDCPEQVQTARTGGGEILAADLGPRLWSGEVTLGRLTRAEAASVLPLLSVLRSAGASFLAYDVTRAAPLADPTGSILGAATPEILELVAGSRELRLGGLPAGYIVSSGDYLGFAYGSGPVRQALHRVVTGAVAAGDGSTGTIEVTPPLRPGASLGAAVTLVKPAIKAVIEPGSTDPGAVTRWLTEGIAFRFIQTLR